MITDAKKKGGRRPIRLRSSEKAVKVETLAKQQSERSWKKVKLREGEKGLLVVEVFHQRVWYWEGKTDRVKHWHLLVRREVDSPNEIKYSLSNAGPETRIERLAHMQGQRFWIERAFQDGKSHCGLDPYQVRGWHHHMALVMIAMLFMLEERILNEEEVPLLSCGDIEILLAQFLARRNATDEEIIAQMERRHQKRKAAIDSHKRKQLLCVPG